MGQITEKQMVDAARAEVPSDEALERTVRAVTGKRHICDGCNVLPPWEHRCHESRMKINGETVPGRCECPECQCPPK